ncbi:MAG TPA: RDD family protein [Chitinophagaceae bacterium]|jgi:uncharacterized RDD family membrane protein YckC|nr:RDD family protein [Chitinophagaceae bacterium]
MEDQNINIEQETGLAEELGSYIQYNRASTIQRFLNYLIDNLLMRFGLSFLTGTLVGLFLAAFFPDYAAKISYDESKFDLLVIGYLIAIVNYLVYYTFCEKVFKGYTLGKLITGTRAIRDDGAELKFKDAILRSLSRLVPLEPLSGFGYRPWHDSWTNTTVIKAR